MLEVLHCAFVLFGFFSSVESPEIFSFACLGILLTRVETVFARLQFSDHSGNPYQSRSNAHSFVPAGTSIATFLLAAASTVNLNEMDSLADAACMKMKREDLAMPQGDKGKYTDKQKRQAEHIEEGYEKKGVSKKEAESRAWATVNKESGGGKKSGSGRGKKENHASSEKGGKKGGKK
jgi:hypothetical protein